MNYTQLAFKKAQEKGYNSIKPYNLIFIDPSFWKALLEATKWQSYESELEPWQYYMLVFSSFKNEFTPETKFKQFFTINQNVQPPMDN